jgi:N-methylhydantoinase A
MLDAEADVDKLNTDFSELDSFASEQLRRDGVPDDAVTVMHAADCRYVGQGYELRVPIPTGQLDDHSLGGVWSEFHRIHEDEYGRSFKQNPIELVNIRVVAVGEMPKIPSFSGLRDGTAEDAFVDERDVHFPGEEGGLEVHSTRFFERTRLPVGAAIDGPAIVLQVDSTTVVPPGASVEVLDTGDLLIRT